VKIQILDIERLHKWKFNHWKVTYVKKANGYVSSPQTVEIFYNPKRFDATKKIGRQVMKEFILAKIVTGNQFSEGLEKHACNLAGEVLEVAS